MAETEQQGESPRRDSPRKITRRNFLGKVGAAAAGAALAACGITEGRHTVERLGAPELDAVVVPDGPFSYKLTDSGGNPLDERYVYYTYFLRPDDFLRKRMKGIPPGNVIPIGPNEIAMKKPFQIKGERGSYQLFQPICDFYARGTSFREPTQVDVGKGGEKIVRRYPGNEGVYLVAKFHWFPQEPEDGGVDWKDECNPVWTHDGGFDTPRWPVEVSPVRQVKRE